MKVSTLFILIPFFTYLPMSIYANCVIDNTKNIGGVVPIGTSIAGQQFLACETGYITSVQVSTSGGDIALYLVEGDGSSINIGNPYQVFPSQPAGLVTLNLEIPFATVDKEECALAIGNVANVTFDGLPVGLPENPDVPNGQFSFEITNGNVFTEIFSSDLVFGVSIAPPIIPPAIIVIPSLSAWGIFIFGLLILNLGLFFVRKKRTVLNIK